MNFDYVTENGVNNNVLTAKYAASRAAQTACHICQAQLHTIIITACRHTSKRILHLLIPVFSAFHLLQNHLILYIIRFQTDSLLNIIQCIYVISKSHVCHGRQIIPLSVPLCPFLYNVPRNLLNEEFREHIVPLHNSYCRYYIF